MSGRRACLTLVFVTEAAGGVFHVVSPAAPLVAGFVTTALVALWCKLDAWHRKVRLPLWNFGLILFLDFVGLPVYFFRTMAFRAAAYRLLKAIGLFLLLSIVAACLPTSLHGCWPPNFRWSGP